VDRRTFNVPLCRYHRRAEAVLAQSDANIPHRLENDPRGLAAHIRSVTSPTKSPQVKYCSASDCSNEIARCLMSASVNRVGWPATSGLPR
jgi:hypothetical protein